MNKDLANKPKKDALIAFGILFGMVFLVTFFFSPADATFCITDSWCLAVINMGKLLYSAGVAMVLAVSLFVIFLIAQTLWVVMWRALMEKPYLVFGGVGALAFLGGGVMQIGKYMAGFLTPFQEQIFRYIVACDVLVALVIVSACFLRYRKGKPFRGMGPLIIFMLGIGVFFAHMLTLPNDIFGWGDVWGLFVFVTCLYALLFAACIQRIRDDRAKKRR